MKLQMDQKEKSSIQRIENPIARNHKTYQTAEIAKCIGVHPNTVRLYETLELIPSPKRKENGYRVFSEFHLEQMKLIRMALMVEVLQNGLRKQAIAMIKVAATKDFDLALSMTEDYIKMIKQEQINAEEAIGIVEKLMSLETQPMDDILLSRQETADELRITIDALRNWEMNGLITIKRKQNGYRVYTKEDMLLLKVIRTLRGANYSLASILRMLTVVKQNPKADIRQTIDTPDGEDDIISVCDKLLTSLQCAKQNAIAMQQQLKKMQQQFI